MSGRGIPLKGQTSNFIAPCSEVPRQSYSKSLSSQGRVEGRDDSKKQNIIPSFPVLLESLLRYVSKVESKAEATPLFFQCYSNAFSKILPKTLVLLVSFQVDKLESPFIHHIFARRAPALEVRQQIQTTRTINTTQHHQHQQPNHHRLDTALSSS